MACVELRPTFQPDNIADQKSPEQHTKELALIQAAAGRAKLLGQQMGGFTAAEREIIKRGEWALEQLLKVHRRIIQKLVSVYRTHKSEFADFEQEAICAFFSAVATYEPTRGSRLITWAYVQIRNRLQELRGSQVKHAIATAKIRQNKRDLTGCEPLQDQGFIRTSIQSLTRKQQEVVRLHLYGFSWVEIAQALQTTADAVRMLWIRAIQRVRRLLLGEEQDKQRPPADVLQSWQETRNYGQPLLRRLFQPLAQTLVWVDQLSGESQQLSKPCPNPLRQLGIISGKFYQMLVLAQQRQRVILHHRTQLYLFFILKRPAPRYFGPNPSGANGVRGSPLLSTVHLSFGSIYS